MKVAFYTLGCKVNLYETEYMMSLFKQNNYDIVDFKSQSDIYVINGCSVTNNSDNKSLKIIKNIINRKYDKILIVTGCFSQNKKEELKDYKIDIILGNNEKSKVIEYLNKYLEDKKNIYVVNNPKDFVFENMYLSHFETKTRAFVKIQDGCDNYCSYCIIPYLRGSCKSKDKDLILKEVNELVNNNYQEVVLSGIHTGFYNSNNYDLSDLLNDLNKIKNLKRIRISSIEVTELNSKFINELKNNKKIVDHLHIPLQSGSDKILKLMNRKYSLDFYYNKIKEIRSIRKDISITTDIIVGFPNESEEDFNNTLEFVKKIKFSKIHVFPFSRRKNTKADVMDNQIDNNIKKIRSNKLIELSKQLEIEYLNKFINKKLDVIFESKEKGYYIGHSSNYILVKTKYKIFKIKKLEYPYLIGGKDE